MRNELEDLKQQALELAKQQLKNKAKNAARTVAHQIVSAILPILPYIIIAFILFIVIIGCIDWGTIEVSAEGMQSASSTSWNQFLRYVEIKEGGPKTEDGQYYLVHDDTLGYPTVGHGLCLKSSDGYLNVSAFSSYGIDSKNLADRWLAGESDLKVSVEVCDAIWEEGLKTRYESIVSQYPDLTTYQHYALTDVKYRRGNTGGFQSEYNNKWSSSDDKYGEEYEEVNESFSTDTLFNFFWDGGHSKEGVNVRKKDQWVLFKYGYYRPLGEKFTANNSTGYADTSSLNANDYGGTYLSSSNGCTFIQYYQNGSSWSSDTLRGASGTNLGWSGCNVTSNAIALSAITGDTITPRQVNNSFNFISNDASAILNTSEFSQYASEIEISGYIDSSVNSLISYLKQGKVVILKFATSSYGRRKCKWLGTNYALCSMCRL